MLIAEMTVAAKRLSPALPLKAPLTDSVWQQTLASPVSCTDIGVHSGKPATLTLRPAIANSGYVFIRTDVPEHSRRISARWDTVTDTSMCTKVSNRHGVSVSTIEHVIAALAGSGITNAILEIDGGEVPIMDGSSAAFIDLIRQAEPRQQGKPVRTLKILKPIEVIHGTSSATLKPSDEPKMTMRFNANGRLGDQMSSLTYYPDQDDFSDLLSTARTLGFYEDAERLWAIGLAQGSSLNNTVVIKDGTIMNEGGLRFPDEFVRHKMLDAVGDLALSGVRLLGHFQGINSGHGLNNQLLRTLFADESAWCFLDTPSAP